MIRKLLTWLPLMFGAILVLSVIAPSSAYAVSGDAIRRGIIKLLEKFDGENPQIGELFDKYALELIEATGGTKTIGPGLLFERIRFDSFVKTSGNPYKISNNHRAFYTRKFHAEHPEYAHLINIRPQRSKKKIVEDKEEN